MQRYLSPWSTLIAFLALTFGAAAHAPPSDDTGTALLNIIAGPQRSEGFVARDAFRHPYETLRFLDIEPGQTVVEIWPGGGYWTEILAPYLRDRGSLIAAIAQQNGASDGTLKANAAFTAKLAADPAAYDKVHVTEFGKRRLEVAPAGSVDRIVIFRELHNLIAQSYADAALRAFYKALKPGGILAIEDHRAAADVPQDPAAKSGYVRQDFAVALAENVGFKLAGSSEIYANPRDTKDYPGGVWTLPPTLRLGDEDRARYVAIGESDRFLLKFVKPAR